MKKFADLHLCPPLNKFSLFESMIEKAYAFGYRMVGVPLQSRARKDEVEQLRDICKNAGVDLVTRIDLSPNSVRELLIDLRHFRRKFEVVSVVCKSKQVARQAAKDRRVDILSFPAMDARKRFFDSAEAELASKALASLEIDMAQLLMFTGFHRIRLLSSFRREIATAARFNVPIVISSGVHDEYLMRSPRDYAALTRLFDMDSAFALRAVSDNPLAIVRRNREKLSPNFVAPGIRVVRRGKNCLSA